MSRTKREKSYFKNDNGHQGLREWVERSVHHRGTKKKVLELFSRT